MAGPAPICEHGRVRTTCRLCAPAAPRHRPRERPLPAVAGVRRDGSASRSDVAIQEFLDDLEAFIARERTVAYARFQDNLKTDLQARLAAGRALDQVEILHVGPEGESTTWAAARCQRNESKFRTGTSLLLHQGDPSKAIPCRLLTDGELEFRLGAEFKKNLTGLKPGPGWVLDEGWSDYSENLQRALDELAQSPRRFWVHGILTGGRRPQFDPARRERAEEKAQRLRLDPDQRAAFVQGFSTLSSHLIQGPPGSGKTAVLANLAAALAGDGQRVLLTAVTHRAINHALRKTQELRPGVDVVKIGGVERSERGVSTFSSLPDWRQGFPGGGAVVGATCHTRLDPAYFDTVIFDEASQLSIPLAIRGLLAGKRYVFIGDDQQMDPVILADHPQPWVSWSVFRLLKEHDPGTMLRTTYRLNDALNAFPSQAFYGGALRSSPEAAQRRLRLARRPDLWPILDPEVPSIVVEIPHAGATVRSLPEARLAARLASCAVGGGLPAHEVVIITPFRAQERLIRAELGRQPGPRLGDVSVETVERVQGQEREMAIVSLTVSDVGYAADAAEFFFRPSRFNVSLTRARSKRIVLMDPGLLRSRPGPEYSSWAAHLRAFHAQTPRLRWDGESVAGSAPRSRPRAAGPT